MAFTFQNRRYGYDNIAPGSATGFERVVPGGGPGDSTTKYSKDSGGNTSTSVLAIGRRENWIKQPTTDDNTVQETIATSNTSHTGYTSGTSVTSVFLEQFGSSDIPGNVS
jgi:hypothetical protein